MNELEKPELMGCLEEGNRQGRSGRVAEEVVGKTLKQKLAGLDF